jgi:flagellar motor switch protein FliN/FliY
VPVSIEIELGRRTLTVSEILNLKNGNVLRLDRSGGENIDLWVGGVLVAYGEIVILEESTGVRITDFVAVD